LPVTAAFPVAKALLSNALQLADKTMALKFTANRAYEPAIGPDSLVSIMTGLA